jgi:hypothetical protein
VKKIRTRIGFKDVVAETECEVERNDVVAETRYRFKPV